MIVCWSVKGGSGTTVVTAALALVISRSRPVRLVDLAGDLPAVLGMSEPAGPGVHDWLNSPTADDAALGRLAVGVAPALDVVHRGSDPDTLGAAIATERWDALAGALHAPEPLPVVDAGCGRPPAALIDDAAASLLVVRPCFLTLRRITTLGVVPTGVIVVRAPGHPYGTRDIERIAGAPVVAEVPLDPVVARAVDAGLLASALPRTLTTRLRRAA